MVPFRTTSRAEPCGHPRPAVLIAARPPDTSALKHKLQSLLIKTLAQILIGPANSNSIRINYSMSRILVVLALASIVCLSMQSRDGGHPAEAKPSIQSLRARASSAQEGHQQGSPFAAFLPVARPPANSFQVGRQACDKAFLASNFARTKTSAEWTAFADDCQRAAQETEEAGRLYIAKFCLHLFYNLNLRCSK